MTIKIMRRAVFFLILVAVCVGAVLQYRTADFKTSRMDAILVMAQAE